MNILSFFNLHKVTKPKPIEYAIGQVWETVSEPSHPWVNDSIIFQYTILDIKDGQVGQVRWIKYFRWNVKSILPKDEQLRHETLEDFSEMLHYRKAKLISIK